MEKKMKKIVSLLTVLLMFVGSAEASEFKKKHKHNIKALSTTKFEVTDSNFQNPRVVDLAGKDFFVVSVREPGSDGQVYAVDRDGTIWWHGLISSGAAGGHETTNGMHKVLLKRRFHMSKTHPNKDGIKNMDFEVEFTPDGEALHLGNTAAMSHGCVHVGRQDISSLFKWARVGMPVVVMRGPYKQFLKQEVEQFKEDLKEYDAATGSHEEKY
jgi:lipoprotein-anchoring transpeptidase ErfK/SrfK